MKYSLIRSKKRRRSLALRVTDSGELIVRAPQYTPKLFIDHFVRSKHDWIAKQQSVRTSSQPNPTKHFDSEQDLQDYIHSKLNHYSQILDLHPIEVKFKKVTSYWGNCHTSGRLTFNLALIYAPPSAVEYVVVHELVHLRHKGHGKRFWSLVNKHCSHTKQARQTLRSIRHLPYATEPPA